MSAAPNIRAERGDDSTSGGGRRRRAVVRSLGRTFSLLTVSTLLLVVVGSVVALFGGARPLLAQTVDDGTALDGLPTVTVVVEDVAADDERLADRLLPALRGIPGVDAAALADHAGPATVVLVADAGDHPLLVDSVRATASQILPDGRVSVGGSAVVADDVAARVDRSLTLAVVPAVALLALAIAWVWGPAAGLTAVAAVGGASLVAARIGGRLAGGFDGSLGRSAVPAALVGLLVATVVTLRLLDVYSRHRDEPARDRLRRAARALGPELGLAAAVLVVANLVTELAAPASAVATLAFVGAVVAALVSGFVTSVVVVSWIRLPDGVERRRLVPPVPDGRQFPVPVLAGFACFLAALGMFSAGAPSVDLVDESALPVESSAPRTRTALRATGGDPGLGLVASLPSASTDAEIRDWARAASNLSHVAWVDTTEGRFVDGVRGTAGFAVDEHVALLSLSAPSRSAAAQGVVPALRSVEGLPGAILLEGDAVTAQAATAAGQATLWLLVGTLALGGALCLLVLTGDPVLALGSLVLRLLGTAGLLGVFGVVAGPVTPAELQTGIVVVAVGLALFELGIVRRIGRAEPLLTEADEDLADHERELLVRRRRVTAALDREGLAAAAGLGVAALAGVGFLMSDLEAVRRLGVSLAAALVIELLLGVWLLRPVVLGNRAAAVSLLAGPLDARPAEAALPERVAAGPIRNGGDPSWHRIVAGLLREEYELQSDPAASGVESVFVENTALHAEVSAHHAQLRAAGLRVSGRGPQVREVHLLTDGAPARVEFVVDHPERRLVGPGGEIVGTRPAERRQGQLWLVRSPSGRYRIAGAVDLGGELLVDDAPVRTSRGAAAAVGV